MTQISSFFICLICLPFLKNICQERQGVVDQEHEVWEEVEPGGDMEDSQDFVDQSQELAKQAVSSVVVVLQVFWNNAVFALLGRVGVGTLGTEMLFSFLACSVGSRDGDPEEFLMLRLQKVRDLFEGESLVERVVELSDDCEGHEVENNVKDLLTGQDHKQIDELDEEAT